MILPEKMSGWQFEQLRCHAAVPNCTAISGEIMELVHGRVEGFC